MGEMKNLSIELMDYEEGRLDYAETIDLFERLVKSGIVWALQGHYARTAIHYMQTGEIAPPDAVVSGAASPA